MVIIYGYLWVIFLRIWGSPCPGKHTSWAGYLRSAVEEMSFTVPWIYKRQTVKRVRSWRRPACLEESKDHKSGQQEYYCQSFWRFFAKNLEVYQSKRIRLIHVHSKKNIWQPWWMVDEVVVCRVSQASLESARTLPIIYSLLSTFPALLCNIFIFHIIPL